MKLRLLLPLVSFLALSISLRSQPAGFESAKAEAEKLFAEKSFAKAHEAYAKINEAEAAAAQSVVVPKHGKE